MLLSYSKDDVNTANKSSNRSDRDVDEHVNRRRRTADVYSIYCVTEERLPTQHILHILYCSSQGELNETMAPPACKTQRQFITVHSNEETLIVEIFS